MQVPSGTARRLGLALAALVSLFVVSSVLVLVHMREIHSRLVEMQARQHAVRSALEVASAIRDTYAHQAHTLILGNDSHLHFYEAAAGRVTRLTEEMKAQAWGPRSGPGWRTSSVHRSRWTRSSAKRSCRRCWREGRRTWSASMAGRWGSCPRWKSARTGW